MPNNSDELYKEIMKNKPNEVRLVLSKIDEILAKDIKNEDYEDCARLRDMKEPLNKFLINELQYNDIKDDLSFANGKIGGLINDAISNAKNKNK
ncbi:hypothetical protein [Flavobacterium sp.]|jgi:hypothetical protein|uniref:hypothetical protein n=1 Tax=Flavobacterium sp. TaxID=239 RepID=UPI0037BFD4F8